MTRHCASRTLLSSCLPWQYAGSRWWGTLERRAGATWPSQAFSSIAAMYPVLAALTARHLRALRLGPTVDGALARIKEVVLRIADACGPE